LTNRIGGVVSLFLLSTFFALRAAQAAVPCSSLWSLGFPEEGRMRDAGQCHPFSPSTGRLNRSQQMYFQDDTFSDPAIKQTMEWAAEAFGYATGKYSMFATVPKIRITFSARPYRSSGTGVTPAFTYTEFFTLGSEFCPIVLYPDLLTFSKAHQMQIVAHEIYHCVQKVTWPNPVADVVQNRSEGQFWFESIAQFMSNDVYPTHDFEYHPMFGRFDPQMPFMMQESPYLSEGFFQGLLWLIGASPSRIHQLQSLFGRAGRTAAQEVMALPNIDQNFHLIARNMSFQELRDSSSAIAPWRVEKREIPVPSTPTSRVNVNFVDFSTEPFELVFPKKGRYRINATLPPGSKLSIRKAGDSTWLDHFPRELLVECSSDLKMEGIITRAAADIATNLTTLDIEREENDTCGCEIEEKPTDACLFGEWEVNPTDVADFMNRATSGALQIHSVTGTLKLKFTPEGDHLWNYQNLTVHARSRSDSRGDRPVEVKMLWNGINTFTYGNARTGSRTSVCSRAKTTGVTALAEATAMGRRFPMPVPIEPMRGEGNLFYSCIGDEFRYEIQAGRIPLNWNFRRVR
jgi:hypothetical protein